MRGVGMLILMGVFLFSCTGKSQEDDEDISASADADGIQDGIHQATGLKTNDGYLLVMANCTPCHSAKLITQNRATREGWQSMIKWMQEKQNLWDLGENEEEILDYLAENYPPEEKGRRENLKNIDWYLLED